jgi:hypothetical protein
MDRSDRNGELALALKPGMEFALILLIPLTYFAREAI